MTVRKHFKQLVRERMHKTGETYSTARRHVIRTAPRKPNDPALCWHFPGNVPGSTALRVLLAHAGVANPRTKAPFSEAMVFGIAAGIGVGVAAFHYAKEDFSSFFIAGRHLWHDDVAYLRNAAARLGCTATIKESGGAKAADKQLRDMLASGPCIAWVDMAHLPHRALPAMFSGGGYHVVPIYKIDGDNALIGDLTDEPITIALKDLAVARARIKKQKHRLLVIDAPKKLPELAELIAAGLRACHQGLTSKPMKGFPSMFNLNAFVQWAERMSGTGAQSWGKIFPRGHNLWRGLTSMHLFIEQYGTGGGLCRPLFAEFLAEAAAAIGDDRLRSLSEQYDAIGAAWSALAKAALPEDVPLLKQAKDGHIRYAELFTGGGSIEEKRAVWAELDQLAAQAKDAFPLTEAECVELRTDLQRRILAIVEGEQAAFTALSAVVADR